MPTLTQLYAEAEAITKPLCLGGVGCGALADQPYHCCEKQHCDRAARFARASYGIELQPTGHDIPFMGPGGCTVPIHLRPICTLHACVFSYAQASNPTEPYWQLRQQILEAEAAAGRRIES